MSSDNIFDISREAKKRLADRGSFNEAMMRLSKLKLKRMENESSSSDENKKAA